MGNGGASPGGVDHQCDGPSFEEKYEQGVTLGKGGSCRVVECKEKDSGKWRAVKILSRKAKKNTSLFQKERDILKSLNHPNIMVYIESFSDRSNYYMISELYEGGELFDRIVDQRNSLTEARVSHLVRTMLLAVQHCHSKNIVHRDIKPENFVFRTRAKDSELVLIDFGCAKQVEDQKRYKDLVGTPYYLAPECAKRKYKRTGRVLKSSDIWAIGIISYMMLTGQPPFDGKSNNEILRNVINQPLKFPGHVSVPKDFKEFCLLILKKCPEERIKLEAALALPWVQEKNACTSNVSKDVLRVLRQFNQQSKLKKAVVQLFADSMAESTEMQIREQFDRLDKNGDGALDSYELSLLLIDMGFTKSQAHVEAKKIITAGDFDGSGKIEFVEFKEIWMRKILSLSDQYIHAVFSILDEDGNGTIEATELASVLHMKGDRDEEKIAKLIEEVDVDGDGVISWSEFYNAMVEKVHFNGAGVGHVLNESDLPTNGDEVSEVKVDL